MHYRSNSTRLCNACADINRSIQQLCVVLTESLWSSFSNQCPRCTSMGVNIPVAKNEIIAKQILIKIDKKEAAN